MGGGSPPGGLAPRGHLEEIVDETMLYSLFDVGGIIGGILAGFATDRTGKPAMICAIMLIIAIPSVRNCNK